MTRDELLKEAKRIGELMNGCGDGNCRYGGRPKGMHTNGGCCCLADPEYRNKGPYNDLRYMATLLGLIALEMEKL